MSAAYSVLEQLCVPPEIALNELSCERRDALVRRQLADILRSPEFAKAPRMRRFLQFVVEETLDGRASQLCEYNIGFSVFDRGEEFEPGLDPIVRNDARRLRQKLAEYYQRPRVANSVAILISIPKGSYVPSFVAPATCSPVADDCYRLTVTLVRMRDRREVWESEQELHSDELRSGVLIQLAGEQQLH